MLHRSLASLLAISIVALAGLATYAGPVSAEPQPQDDHAEYRNERFGYSVIVPAAVQVSEEHGDSDGQTIVFKDPTTNQLFHISAVRYSVLDVTLGTSTAAEGNASDQPDHIEIVSAVRGDVFKVWFTKNGVFYVAVTFPEDEQWLVDILKTWEFISRTV